MKTKLLLGLIICVVLVSGCVQLPQEIQPSCGDDTCNSDELCFTCPHDCGICAPVCGDGTCNVNEVCSSCSIDCGECSASLYCGDDLCNGNETCSNCANDCDVCPHVCGDSICSIDETCSSCPTDCGACPTKCGNSICELIEDCNNCLKDCGCVGDQYCDSGICRTPICGDDICSSDETGLCCEDCGCTDNKICNEYTQECQVKSISSETDVTTITNNYLDEKSITGTIIKISDTYYEDQAVKQVSIDCTAEGDPVSCQIILLIDNEGMIVQQYLMG